MIVKKIIVFLSLLFSGVAFAKDGITMISDASSQKDESATGIRIKQPLTETDATGQSMNQRWGAVTKPKVEIYGTIDVGYTYTSK